MRFRSQATGGEFFPTREKYLKDSVGKGFKGNVRRLCNVIEKTNGPIRKALVKPLPQEMGVPSRRPAQGKVAKSGGRGPSLPPTAASARTHRVALAGFPWITLVLGSGCLETIESSDRRWLEMAGSRVRAALGGAEELPNGERPTELAAVFIESLVRDRMGLLAPRRGTDDSEAKRPLITGADALVADLALSSALLTMLYHRMMAATPQAVARFGNDEGTLRRDAHATHEIRSGLIEPALACLASVRLQAASSPVRRLVDDVVGRIQKSLSPGAGPNSLPRLALEDVQVMTELTWHVLTQDTDLYPGWTDLMLSLAVHDDDEPEVRQGRLWPRVNNLSHMPPLIMERLKDLTESTWERLSADQPRSGREQLYDTAAAMVQAQAEARVEPNADGSEGIDKRLPCASIFVTSFDLELEMALWHSDARMPFVVAMPFNLLIGPSADSDRTAATCWLGCLIDPMTSDVSTIDEFRDPKDWFVLNDPSRADLLQTNPVVVRLNGCPMFAKPPLTNDAGGWAPWFEKLLEAVEITPPEEVSEANGEGATLELEHALLVDEYAAMQHSALELEDNGLPIGLSTPGDAYSARFWLMLGVQVGDSIVRYRFASHLAASEVRSAGVQSVAPLRTGVVVNKRRQAGARDLLDWYGFDLVTADCEAFRDDLAHYVLHLRSKKRCRPNEECEL